jgi:O-glycosyl hydrolase
MNTENTFCGRGDAVVNASELKTVTPRLGITDRNLEPKQQEAIDQACHPQRPEAGDTPKAKLLSVQFRLWNTCTICLALLLLGSVADAATITFNGGVTYQAIDGFGVNANHRSWNNDELRPVLDALIDQAGMTLFRVVYDDADWEASNDNSDPNVMNWSYYAPLYRSAEFTKMWNLIAYLNGKGITTNGVIFNFMGPGPGWMGGSSLAAGKESEWAEMIASLLVWARYTNGLQFTYVGPDNEPDIANEGITITSASQYVTALRALAQKLDANGLSDVRLIGPDRAGGGTAYMPEMMADAVVMGKLAHFGVHSYSSGGGGSSGVYTYLQGSAYPDRTFWMTEFNVWCSTCDGGTRGTYDWAYCEGTANYLLSHLANGASGGTVWEGYDSYYVHPPTAWSFWGLLGVDNENAAVKTYTPRKNFYTVAQISKFVRPGAQRIGVSGSSSPFSPLLAFKHTGLGQITIVGINSSGSAATLSGALASLPTVPHLDLYYTSPTANLANGGSVAVNNGTFSATIPADCVFTLTGFTGVNVALTSPVNGAQFNEPATIPLAATATTTAGSIELVGFYNGVAELGEITLAPYEFTWNNVPMGNYALSALAGDTLGNIGTSAVVNVTVVGPLAQIEVTPASATVAPGGKQQFSATGADLLGHTLVPQPAFGWSVSGGGTIDGTGLFTAGSAAGGPFNVAAGSGGFTGTAGVSVAAVSGGTIGNTKEGASSDTMWSNGAWINACRFQAASNMVVSTMGAKVGAISGGYKCAIYADRSGNANALLGGTTEVRSPASGWNVFPLTSPVTLTNGQYYWLAIWSDDASAKVYYSDTSGTLRWGQYNYGAWPNPISTTGGNTLDYCIYAVGAAGPAPTLTSIAVTPANPTLLTGTSQPFAATGTYSDGSTQNVTSQATWISSSPAVATITATGLASGVSAGTTTISALLAGVTGVTTLTVQTAPLAIVTTSLPGGVVNVGYSGALAATGGTAPYTWSVASGALPPGLTLNAISGAISGTPITTGAFSLSVQVRDTSIPVKTATKSLGITISSVPVVVTIWPTTAAPGQVDGGTMRAAELGVQFSSDVVGTVTGIRFYKASANIGTHVGSLWTSAGTRLATATFTGETASGWQQMDFATPAAISANTVYVASYHVNSGHHSADANYFSTAGVDNPPLHALPKSVTGGNGRYSSRSSSTFPNTSGNGTNYWVDVVFKPAAVATLTSLAVTPANPTMVARGTQQLTATGTYSDGSTQNVTSQATWSSSKTTVATVSATGVATAVSAGSTVISAALAGVTGSGTLAVQALPITITTTSLAAGTVSVACSATLTASGGTTPYAWLIASGSLPPGLTLNPDSGAIAGTPTAAGTFSFSAQVTDAGNPMQTATKGLSITIASVPVAASIWPSTTVPGVVDEGPDSSVELGVKFRSDVAGKITGIRFYKATANTGTHVGSLWNSAGTKLAAATFSGETASGWQQVNFSTPVAITANTVYVASYHANNGHYSADVNYFASRGVDNPPLHALANGVSGGDGVYRYGTTSAFPNQTWYSANYWVDVVFAPSNP